MFVYSSLSVNYSQEMQIKTFKKIPFTHKDKKYEIMIMYDDAIIKVVAFLHNHPANTFLYVINFPKYYDMNIAR
jgi:hypothetical protein